MIFAASCVINIFKHYHDSSVKQTKVPLCSLLNLKQVIHYCHYIYAVSIWILYFTLQNCLNIWGQYDVFVVVVVVDETNNCICTDIYWLNMNIV